MAATRFPRWASTQAYDLAQQTGGTVDFRSGEVSNEWGPTSIGIYYVWPPSGGNSPPSGGRATPGSGNPGLGFGGATTGGQLGGGGVGNPSQAGGIAIAQANTPQFTGGGDGFGIGAGATRTQLPVRDDDWHGLNSLTPDNKLQSGYAPRSINWDSFRKIGSRCSRDGAAKNTDDIDTMTASGGGALNSDYRGLSLAMIPGTGTIGDLLVYGFIDKDIDIGTASGAEQAMTHHVCTVGPRWGKPLDLTGMPGPTLALSDQTGHVLRVTAEHLAIPAGQLGLRKQTVVGISIRVVGPATGATPRYPSDIDGNDGSGSAFLATTGPSNVDRRAWTGVSTNYDSVAFAAGGKYWVAAWTISREGISLPRVASLTIA